MTAHESYDVTVVGGGPAGLAAAISASNEGASVLLIEREARLGGILKQCVHDGFGLIRFGERLSGPEYAARFIDLIDARIRVCTLTFVTRITRGEQGVFFLTLVSREGVRQVETRALVLATGCRERTSRQIGIHGRHCAGVFTAGTAQHIVNLLGYMPTRRCVILGSGDIGLIMARRLTLEGAQVMGVYEAKPTPSGLMRNVVQCLYDFDIPLYTGKTVSRLIGEQRLCAVEICDVDQAMRPIAGTEQTVSCDALILSVGLIPENELAESIHVPLDPKTGGPIVDEDYQTLIAGVYACGNALFVNDLADYVSQSGETAGRAAACCGQLTRDLVRTESNALLLALAPQRLNRDAQRETRTFFLRAAREMAHGVLTVSIDGQTLLTKRLAHLRPPEMERVELNIPREALRNGDCVRFCLEEVAS